MSIHLVFAANLRRFCAEYGTIADVCRGIGINRQQFNKYLAERSIPNAITLRRICTFLNISEQSLFVDDRGITRASEILPVMPRRGPLGFFQFASKNYDFEVRDLPCGNYECFMPLPNAPGMLVRSLVRVTQTGRQKEFVRLTRFPSSDRSSKPLARGRHKGVVFANNSEIYFLGVNRFAPYQVSFMATKRFEGGSMGFCKGMIMTHNFTSPMTSKVCLIFAANQDDTKSFVRSLGIIHSTEVESNGVISDVLYA
jgi:transcriptional regulator with XRE-family HTH domain